MFPGTNRVTQKGRGGHHPHDNFHRGRDDSYLARHGPPIRMPLTKRRRVLPQIQVAHCQAYLVPPQILQGDKGQLPHRFKAWHDDLHCPVREGVPSGKPLS